MNRLNWWLTRVWDDLPLLQLLSWASLLAIVWLIIAEWMPAHRQLAEIKSVLPVQKVIEQEQPYESEDSRFLSSAPEVEKVSSAIKTLFQLAAKHRLNLSEVNYQKQAKPDEPILPYSIDFNVEASYPAIKSFLTELLAALPYLALQQIRFERETINDRAAKVQLKLSLYLSHE